MQIIDCEQVSETWYKARSGVITASNFKDCCSELKTGKNKGYVNAKADEYAFRLAIERISGNILSDDKFDTFEMKRGRELEPEARLAHENKKGILVEQTGFAKTDDGLFGASVDGFVGEKGTSEYKCFISPKSLMPILLKNDLTNIEHQIQGQLWVTGREWCDFVLYCPALKCINKDITIITKELNEDFVFEMEEKLLKFNVIVNNYIEILKA